MKAWQQLIQSQTPNGLSAPSLAGAAGAPTITANNKSEQSSANDGQQPQQSNVSDSRQRRKSISSSSREGTPNRSSTTMVGEPLVSKSTHPPPPPIATATAGGGTRLQTNASRTPTPTPSPHPSPATPTSSSSSTSLAPQAPPSSVASSTPQTAAVIPRPTKAQDFARNRIRRMQMLAQVTPQSQKPAAVVPQAPVPAAAATSTTTSSMANELQPKSQEVNASQQQQRQQQSGGDISQSLTSQQQLPPIAAGAEAFHNASSIKATTGLVSQSDHTLAMSPVLNGSHFFKAAAGTMAAVSDSKSFSKSSLSSSSNKFISAHSRSTPSLSQIVTNSFNHDPPPPPPPPPSSLAESHFSSTPPVSNSTAGSSLSTTIAHKVGVKGSQERGTRSHERLTETPSPPEESLLVQIPRSLVHISRRNHKLREAKELHHHNFGRDRQGLSSDLEEFSLTVSIDLSLLHQFSNSQQVIGGSLEDVKRNRTEWFVKEGHHIPENMDPSLHKFGDASEPMETDTITSFGSGGISRVPTFTSSGHFTAFGSGSARIPHLPTPEPRLVPSGASPGVDGCMGSDGYWYSWTDSIPGHDVSVTVLPYIYVDDDESDAMEVFTN